MLTERGKGETEKHRPIKALLVEFGITFALDETSPLPLYEQLYRHIAREILEGRLTGGVRLPSRRALSHHLGISEQTVGNALDLLKAEGFLLSRPRQGLYVAPMNPLPPLPAPDMHKPIVRQPKPRSLYDFSPQGVDTGLFPHKVWIKLLRDSLLDHPELLNKGHAKGEPSLRAALASFLYQYRAVRCQAEQIIIGSGVDQLLGVLGQIISPQSRVALEDPGYPEAASALSRLGHTTLPIPLNEEGPSLAALEASRAALLYITPSHQFPTGISMPAGRRTALLHWAKAGGRYLIEDDYDSEFRYASRPLPALQGMDGGQQVVYIGTFSRSLAPGLRVAYMALPPPLLARYEALNLRSGDAVSRFEQHALGLLISQGHYARHLRRAGNVYQKRCQRLCDLLLDIPGSSVQGQDAGLHFLFSISGRQEAELVSKAARAGMTLKALHDYSAQARLPQALVLGFAGLADAHLEDAVNALRQAWGV
ncbi:MAG: PLP-dependent aminotransferase family protein [Christensenellales bacterium]|jgi:GntR family transcriptional regulator/MocR family aminotransferase